MARLVAVVACDYSIWLIRSPLRRRRSWRSGGTLLKSRRFRRLVDGGDGFCHLLAFPCVLLKKKKGKEKMTEPPIENEKH